MMRCSALGPRLRDNSFLSVGKRRKSKDSDYPPPGVVKSGILYLLTNGNTLLRIWTIVRKDKKLICYDEPDRLLLVASTSLEGRYVLIGRGTAVEKETFYPLYIAEKDQLAECFFAVTQADQREWLEAMTSAADLDQSLSLKGLNLECGKAIIPVKEKNNRDTISSYFGENAPQLSALRDLEESNRQTALRRATLLKQRMISTELKVDGLKKMHPEPIYEIPANKLYYQTQLDELNIKLGNYTEAFHKCHEKRTQSLSDSLGRFTGEKRNDEHCYSALDISEGSKCKSTLRIIGNFLDVKLRGHKRTKSDDVKSDKVIDGIRPRSVSTTNTYCHSSGESQLLQVPCAKEKTLQTEISASALHEIEEFEKFIKRYLEKHRGEYFF